MRRSGELPPIANDDSEPTANLGSTAKDPEVRTPRFETEVGVGQPEEVGQSQPAIRDQEALIHVGNNDFEPL